MGGQIKGHIFKILISPLVFVPSLLVRNVFQYAGTWMVYIDAATHLCYDDSVSGRSSSYQS